MKKQQGITLLEIILVLAVATSFFLIGFRVYQQFKQQRLATELRANADILTQGMANYYRSYCRSGGKLGISTSIAVIDIDNDLVKNGFLKTTWNIPSAIIGGFVAQFNPYVSTRYVTVNADWPNAPTQLSTPQKIAKDNSVYIWKIQVAIKIVDTANIQTYRNLSGATCVSSKTGDTVTSCANSTGKGDYLVWERLPSFASPSSLSPLWPSIARMKQFNQNYTNDDLYAFTTDNVDWDVDTQYEIYLCGG